MLLSAVMKRLAFFAALTLFCVSPLFAQDQPDGNGLVQRVCAQCHMGGVRGAPDMDALRAAHVGVKGPIDAAAASAAKYQDKLSTGNEILDAVKAKLAGQADAYAKTASGGMAQLAPGFCGR